MKRMIFTLVLTISLLGMLFTWPSDKSQLFALGDFEGNEACETCVEVANELREQCYALWDYGRGDPDCDAKFDRAIGLCQTTYCIYRESDSVAAALDAVVPTAFADARCDHAKKTCRARAEFILNTCVIVYGDSEAALQKCIDQAEAYMATCMGGAGC